MHATKMYRGTEEKLHSLLTMALNGGVCGVNFAPGCFIPPPPGKTPAVPNEYEAERAPQPVWMF
jgi:hypothetical protein